MDIRRVQYFTIASQDRPGELARFAKNMMDANVNLEGIWGFSKGAGRAEIVTVPLDPERFKTAIQQTGWTATSGICFHMTGEDRIGAISDTLDRVAREGLNLHAFDGLAHNGRYSAYVWAQEKDVELLGKILKG